MKVWVEDKKRRGMFLVIWGKKSDKNAGVIYLYWNYWCHMVDLFPLDCLICRNKKYFTLSIVLLWSLITDEVLRAVEIQRGFAYPCPGITP